MIAATLGNERPPGGSSGSLSDADAEALPQWFVVALVGALAVLVGFGTVGLILAVAGAFVPVPTLGVGLAVTVALIMAVAPWRIPARHDLGTQLPAALAVALVTAAVAYAMRYRAEHVILDRDPGGYMVTARWLATHHNLEFAARVGAFAETTGLKYSSPAVYDRGGGDLYFQFSHFLPSLIAQARWIGGDRLMFLTPPVLGGLGLMSFYALATRFVRPWLALAALAALATNLVELHFMRDAYSELPTQAVLLGGLWLLTRRDAPRPAVAAFTGFLLGATAMVRIDGPLYLVCIAAALGATAFAWRRGDGDSRERIVAAKWLVGAALSAIAIGIADVWWRSTAYFADLVWLILAQYAGLVVACVVAVGMAVWRPAFVARLAELARGRAADIAAVAVAVGLFAAWFLRPHIERTRYSGHPFIAALQRADNVRVDDTLRYNEYSLVWHSWYLGPITLAAGIVGVALLTRRVLRGRAGPTGLVVAAFLPATIVYLVHPSIFPDQIWVMRRFLPFIIPGFVLWSFVVVDRLIDARGRRLRPPVARAAAAVLLVAAIAWPVHTVLPVRADTTQRGFLDRIEEVCRVLGPRSAAVVLQGASLELMLPQTLRSYCNIPVAVRIFDPESPGLNGPGFKRLAEAWRLRGRTLFVIADTASRIDHIVGGLTPVAQIHARNGLFLRERIVGRPDGYRSEAYSITIAPVR